MSSTHRTGPVVGLVGCGRWGRLILRDLVTLGAEVHVAAPSETGRQTAVAGGARRVVASAGQLPDADGYVVATPTVTHAEVVGSLLPRGRPVFCEKPLTADEDAAARLVERGADQIFVMDKWRYHRGVEELSRLAGRGAFGPIRSVRTYRLGWGNPHSDVDAVWILLPHDLSIVQEILGHLPVPRHAQSGSSRDREAHLLSVLYDAPGDVVVTCEVSSVDPVNRRSVVVVGEEGSGQLSDSYDDHVVLAGRVDGAEVSEATRLHMVGDQLPLEAELRAFLGHLAGGPPPKSSAEEALSVVRVVAELRRMAGLR